MFDRILVPIDIASENDPAAVLQIARTFAGDYGSQLHLLNIVPPIPGYVAPHLPPGAHESMTSQAAAALIDMARKNDLPENTETAVRTGRPADGILDYAENHKVEAIFVASHDPGVADYVLGSTAARVVRHAHCSVFVIRNLQESREAA